MSFIATQGYLVRWADIGRGDRWFRFFTRDQGLLHVIAGRQKLEQTPPLAGPLPFDLGFLNLTRRRQGGTRLSEYQILRRHLWLTRDLDTLAAGLLFLESVDKLSPEEEPQQEVFRLMGGFLRCLEIGLDPVDAQLWAFPRLFKLLGYELAFDLCRRCRGAPGKKNYFQAGQGGFVHERCATGAHGLQVSPGTLLYLGRLSGASLEAMPRLKGDRLVRRESFDLLMSYLNFLCQERLRSQVFREKVADSASLPSGERKSEERHKERHR